MESLPLPSFRPAVPPLVRSAGSPVVGIRAQIRASRQNPRQCTVPEKLMAKPIGWRRRALGVLAAAGLLGGQGLPAQACTSFVLKGSDGGRVYGGTPEKAKSIPAQLVSEMRRR